MSTTEIRLPAALLRRAREMAERENMTLEQFASSALAEKMAAWATVAYLEERAARGDRQKFERALDNVPDAEPDECDRPWPHRHARTAAEQARAEGRIRAEEED